jgi:hypothetical protein
MFDCCLISEKIIPVKLLWEWVARYALTQLLQVFLGLYRSRGHPTQKGTAAGYGMVSTRNSCADLKSAVEENRYFKLPVPDGNDQEAQTSAGHMAERPDKQREALYEKGALS